MRGLPPSTSQSNAPPGIPGRTPAIQPPALSLAQANRSQAEQLKQCGDEMPRRLRQVLENHSAEELARDTGVSGESVRRYLAGDAPSSRFLTALCLHKGVCGTWLLTGIGSPVRTESARQVLSQTSTDEILGELGRRFDRVFSIPVR